MSKTVDKCSFGKLLEISWLQGVPQSHLSLVYGAMIFFIDFILVFLECINMIIHFEQFYSKYIFLNHFNNLKSHCCKEDTHSEIYGIN